MLSLTRQDLNLPRIRHITTLHLSLTKCYFTLPTYNAPYYQLTSIAYYIRLYLLAMRYVTVLTMALSLACITYNTWHCLLRIHYITYVQYINLQTLTFSFPSYRQKKDVERTIGIDTDYIETNDFNLEPADKLFLIEVRPFLHMKSLVHADTSLQTLDAFPDSP